MNRKKKIFTVVGARPQFIKAAMVSRAILDRDGLEEVILHTGQHYDAEMSQIFFDEMNIPKPIVNLEVGSASHATPTAEMMKGIENEITKQKPDWVLVYGDTNSTLAGALTASKMGVPVAHVEAGLRSFNRAMPEEINRVLTDHVADLLFCPTDTAVENLKKEGVVNGCNKVGDVMVDALYFFRNRAKALNNKTYANGDYFLLTLHRQSNTDDSKTLNSILQALGESKIPFVFPVHPRTKAALKRHRIELPKNINAIEPVGYPEMVHLIQNSQAVWTDSGGLQKEAVVLGKPCFTLRTETEWLETVAQKWNILVGTDPSKIETILNNWTTFVQEEPFDTGEFYGDGKSAEKIALVLGR